MALINCAENKVEKLCHGNFSDCSTMEILCTNKVSLTGRKLAMTELAESFEPTEVSGCDVGPSSKQVQEDYEDQDEEEEGEDDEEEEGHYAAIKSLLHIGESRMANSFSSSAQSPCSTLGSTEITTSSKVRPWQQICGDLERILASRVRAAEVQNEKGGTLKEQLKLVEENVKQEKIEVEEYEDVFMIQQSERVSREEFLFKDIPDWCPGEEVLDPRAWMSAELDPKLLQTSEQLRLVLELQIMPDQWPKETVITKQDDRFHGNHSCFRELLFRIMATSAHKDTCRQAFQTLCGLNCYAGCLWPFPQWVPTFFHLIRTMVALGATPTSLFPAVGFHPVFSTCLPSLDILADQHGVSSPGKDACNPPGLYFLVQYLTLCIYHEIKVFSKREHVLLVALCARLMLQRGLDMETLCALRQLLSLLLTKFDSWLSQCSELAGCLSHLSDNHHNLLELVLSLPCQAPRDRELQVHTGLAVISRLLLGDKSTVPSKFKLSLLLPLLSKIRPSALQHLIQSPSNEETNKFEVA
uniref:uncharacterized protein isoform X1 n=1 Tax=Myxine glutinosa TaxID=7769 RepID=UPI003590086D